MFLPDFKNFLCQQNNQFNQSARASLALVIAQAMENLIERNP
jgi:hypothetical protein